MNRTMKSLLPAALMFLMASPALGARPVARVLEVKGKVTIERSKDSVRPAQVYGTVYAGEKLIVAEKSYAVLGFREDGHLERLKPGGTVTVAASGCEPKTAVEPVAVPKPLKPATDGAVRQLRPVTQGGVTIVRAGGDEKPLPPRVSPIVGSTVISRRPTFAWPPVTKAARYQVIVYSGGERVWSGTTEKTQLAYGAPAKLRASFAYHWEVLATLEDDNVKRFCEGEFTVATQQQRDVAADLEKLAADPQVPYLTLAAAWYHENGLIAEALALDQRLAKLLPESVPVQAALADLYTRAGRGEDAERARREYKRLRPPPAKPPWLRFPNPK